MGDTRIISDTAHSTAREIVQIFVSLLRDEELKDAFDEVFERVKTGLERYALLREREWRRLHGPPGTN